MKTTSGGILCHKDYRTTVPLIRVFYAVLFAGLALRGVYPGSPVLFAVMLLFLWWSIRQWIFARASWALEGNRLQNSLMNKTLMLDLNTAHCISRADVQCIQIKDHGGYAQMQFYVFSRLPSAFRTGLIGYGGPSAIRRMIENGLLLLPVNDETNQLIRQRYPDKTIPEYPAYIRSETD
jgi:hypothetical protein